MNSGLRALCCQRTAASLDLLFLQWAIELAHFLCWLGEGSGLCWGTKPATRCGPSAQLLPGLTSPQAHIRSSDHETRCSDPARCHTPRDSAVPTPPPTFLPRVHMQSLPCFCPSCAGRGQGWDSSLCTSHTLSTAIAPHSYTSNTLHFTTLLSQQPTKPLGNLHA